MKETKIFISMPMNGLNKNEIEGAFKRVEEKLSHTFPKYHILQSYIKDHETKTPLESLGHSLIIMSKADVVVFAKGYQNARGCKIEFECAKQYGKEIYLEEELQN